LVPEERQATKMKITKRQLRRIIKEEKARLLQEQQASQQAWANEHGGEVDRDEEGQTIIYLSKEEYPSEGDIVGILPPEWDYGDGHDGEWTVYTGLYSAGSISRSHPRKRR